jgi:hypothetical protein
LDYSLGIYFRIRPSKSAEISIKIFGEFGNSGELKEKYSAEQSATSSSSQAAVSLSKNFFDFGSLYKIYVSLPKSKQEMLDKLKKSYIIVTYDKAKCLFYHVPSKKESTNNRDDDESIVKIKFYEQVSEI